MSDRLDEEARADPKGAKAERLRKAAAAARKANGHAGETEEPQAAEPGPAGEQQQHGFHVVRDGERRRAGVYKLVGKEGKEPDKKAKGWSRFCSLLEIEAETRNAAGEQWGRLVRVIDRDGTAHILAMPMAMLAGDGVAYRERLLALGLELAPGRFARDALHEYLTVWEPGTKVRCVERTGWHGAAFVLPDTTFGGAAGDERVLLQTAGTAPAFDVAGSLESWREGVARHAIGNSRLALGVSTAFAGPLLFLLGDESGGFHFVGGSSIGKTTVLHCGASAWGCAVRSWRTTDNAVEALARGASDALLPLDEISQAEARAIDAISYMLGNGQGKARMHRDASAREAITWRVLFLSTGETGIAAKMQEGGRRARAGQEVRVVEVLADAGKGLGVFEDLLLLCHERD